MEFKPFDHQDPPEDGLYWVCVTRQEWDVDADDDGRTVGVPTGGSTQGTALVWINTMPDGELDFDAVDPVNLGRVCDDDFVTHYAEVQPPALPTAA
ncbi:hypothetical protein QU487_06595 [Crenobacter sp. SG2305]|uniref:hypothetical protein n=1 Tax=Crenobacter oryzisoli TaxID=3056844 RepID=UPI0025AADEA5|nr:hypothetical protein [Crenobacter sp. SG2305]MDN0082422.1 hypothetical protein [Crenobacter sp. SG2305]